MPAHPLPTPSAPPAAGPYSHAVRAGDWVVCAGQIPLDPATGTLVEGDVTAQAERVLGNVRAVLGDVGGTLADVAKATIFLVDLADFAAVNAVYAEAFGDHRPARSTIQVAALPAGARVEIEVWAHLPVAG
ncbi:MAG: Rid family detoxifying hydrolase [Actinomycetes bacterium]